MIFNEILSYSFAQSSSALSDVTPDASKKFVKVAETRPALSASSVSAPASFPATRLNKNHVPQSSMKVTSRLNKETLKKRLEIQKQSQQLLEKQIAQQKVRFILQ